MSDFNMICAVSLNGVIGDSSTNSIPWYLPADLKNFKAVTSNHTIVMGAKTFLSLGRKLPNRRNVVITRGNTELPFEPDEKYSSFADVMRNEKDFFVIGGEHIFSEALIYQPTRLFLTIVKIDGQGDVRFPVIGHTLTYDKIPTKGGMYLEESRSEWMSDNGVEYQFTVFKHE